MSKPIIQLRDYQDAAFRHHIGMLAWLYRRQSGKSYGLGITALDWMMEDICDVIFASAALRLGQENIRKEAEIWSQFTSSLREAYAQAGFNLTTSADKKGSQKGGELLDLDAICDLFEHQKLETRLWHTQSRFSRSMVVAPNPDTAVGWTGHIILDEVGRIPNFQDVFEAMEPIISSNPQFKVRLATTPPPDDSHYSYELLAPDPEELFETDPRGNYYTSQAGILVHRVDAWDGHAAGVPLYSTKDRQPMDPDEHRKIAIDKTAWDRNYGIKFIAGGTSALSLTALNYAQAAGLDQGLGIHITDQLQAA